jgi:hypothetical protein
MESSITITPVGKNMLVTNAYHHNSEYVY